MKRLFYFIFGLLLVSCGPTVNYDYDKEVNFSQKNTYNFYPNIASGLNELDNQRIITSIDSILQQQGMSRNEDPQILINFYSREHITNTRSSVGIGMGGTGRNIGVGISGGIPIGGRSVSQQITIDLIDAKRDALIWQAVINSEYRERATPSQKETHYHSILQKAFKKYPPKN